MARIDSVELTEIGPVYMVPNVGEGLSLFVVNLMVALGSSGDEMTTDIGP